MKGAEAKQNSPTSMRTMSLMECVGSAEVQVIRSWRLTQSSIISELVIWTNSSNCCSEREFIPMNKWMIGRSSKRATNTQSKHSTVNSTCWELLSVTMRT